MLHYHYTIFRLQFLKACYGKPVIPNRSPKDFKWTREAVKMNCVQGYIYIKSIHPLLNSVSTI